MTSAARTSQLAGSQELTSKSSIFCGSRIWQLHHLFFFFLGGAVLLFYGSLVLKSVDCPLPNEQRPLLFYSNHHKQSLKLTVCQALKKAKHSIFMMMYALTDPDIIALLEKRAAEGINIRLFLDAKQASSSYLKIPVFPVHSSGLMHRKILVIDEEEIFIGSANFTPTSLKLHDNFMVGLHHPSLGRHLTHDSHSPFTFSIEDGSGELWLLPDPSGAALDRIIDLLHKAKKSIKVAMFTLTHPLLIDSLASAYKRGVKVEVAVDFFTGQGASLDSLSKLKAVHIPVSLSGGAQLFHHKWILIDKNILIVGSANWTQAAFEKNEDNFLILHSLTADQKKYVKKMWKIIKSETNSFSNFEFDE